MKNFLYKSFKFVTIRTSLFRWFYKDLKNLFDYLTINSKGSVFKFLFNLRAFLNFNSKGIKITKKIDNYYLLKGKLNGKDINWNYTFELMCYYNLREGFDDRVRVLNKQYLLDFIDFEEGDNIFDVGAHQGDFYLCLMNLGMKNINYFAFEPAPFAFANLKRNMENNKIINTKIFNIGLWNQDKKLKFYLSENRADSSFIFPRNCTSTIYIEAKKLSSIIKEPIKLLKLEAEGGEPEVLEGIGDKLNLIKYISADLGFERGLKSESTIPAVSNYLINRGFDFVSVDPVRLICLFKNKNLNF